MAPDDQKKKLCFVAGPIGDANTTTRAHADWLLRGIIQPIFTEHFAEFHVERADQIKVANGGSFAMGRAIELRTDCTSATLRLLAKRGKDTAQTRRLLAIAAVGYRDAELLMHDTVYRALKELGFSHVSARPKAYKQDPEAIEAFKKISPSAWRKSARSSPRAHR